MSHNPVAPPPSIDGEQAAMMKDGELRWVDADKVEEHKKLGWLHTNQSPPWGDDPNWPPPPAPMLEWKDRYPWKAKRRRSAR